MGGSKVAHVDKGLPAAVRTAGRAVTRSAGLATSPLRPLPDFVIIGAKRGGTTSLFDHLTSHPQVLRLFPSARRLPLRADRKGVHYLDARFDAGPAWYRSNFASQPYRRIVARRVGGPLVAGEATPYYLFHPHAAERARSVMPEVKAIALLRDPVERAHSHYREQRRRGHEALDTFEAAVEAEAERTAGDQSRLERDAHHRSFAHEHQSYVAQGEYLAGLERWLDRFGPDQVLVVRSEDLYADPQSAFDQVTDFLGLRRASLADPSARNATAPAAPMAPDLRARLTTHFSPHNAALEARLGRRFGWAAP